MKTLGVVAVAALTLALVGCATAPESPQRAVVTIEKVAPAPTKPVTITPVGDSLTAWIDYDGNHADTWVSHLPATVTHQGGYAAGGAPTVVMRDNVTPTGADVAVILAGTNDVAGYPSGVIPPEQILANIDAIAATVAASDVLIVALGPSDKYTTQNVEFNALLKAHTHARGWGWIDPWVEFRADDGTFIPGTGLDGVHPVPDVQAQIGEIIGCGALKLRGYSCP